ncbi:hypothetical protein D5366_01225 [Neokomagataea tanensis]|uniref:Uncharacterized protein n=1 Tax=Neokomagataea tanensis TaxID=661191 RepID=A0A4Y6V5F8_9PROT|nr:hypothetical protein D5366_01225 [Neokomagataea tanensis]
MHARILDYNVIKDEGSINGNDGLRRRFSSMNIKAQVRSFGWGMAFILSLLGDAQRSFFLHSTDAEISIFPRYFRPA